MLNKRIQFPGVDQHGNILTQSLFPQSGGLVKTAGAVHPEIAAFTSRIRKHSGKLYVLINALSAGEYWGCFPSGSLVTMADQTQKRIEDVEVGELVISAKGEKQAVTARQIKHFEGGIKRVLTAGSNVALYCTPNHPIYAVQEEDYRKLRAKIVYRRKRKDPDASYEEAETEFKRALLNARVRIPAEELRKGDYVFRHFSTHEAAHPVIDTPAKARLAGYYLAEGCIARNYKKADKPTTRLIFVVGSHEPNLCSQIEDAAKECGWAVASRVQNNSIRIEVSTPAFAEALHDELGGLGRAKKLSTAVLNMPKELQAYFLAAYMNGDGCQTTGPPRSAGSLKLTTASFQLAEDLTQLLARFGVLSTITQRHNTKATWYCGRPIFSVDIGSSQAMPLLAQMPGHRFNEDYKKGPARSESTIFENQIMTPVRSVEEEDFEGYVHNLTIKNTHKYLVNRVSVGNSNINGDWFSEEALKHKGRDYGYETFYDAGIYLHHANKDRTKSIGNIVLSVYNDTMHRVELIQEIDRDKAAMEGAGDIVEQLDAGKHPPTSMGCKVPHDICSVCGKQSKTTADYCEHALTHLNYVADAELAALWGVNVGHKVYLINSRPKFFDDSYVVVGADQTSYAIQKVASTGHVMPSAFLTHGEVMEKAAKSKLADMIKRVPSMSLRTMSALQKAEHELPPRVTASMGEDLERALSTLARLGIVLKPSEFQHAALHGMRHGKFADRLAREGKVFRMTRRSVGPISYSATDVDPALRRLLIEHIQGRSIFSPLLSRRAKFMVKHKHAAMGEKIKVAHPLLDSVSSMYNGYLEALPDQIAMAADIAASDPAVVDNVDPLGILEKRAGRRAAYLGAYPLLYLYSSTLKKRKQAGEELTPLNSFISNHPVIAASFLTGGAMLGKKML